MPRSSPGGGGGGGGGALDTARIDRCITSTIQVHSKGPRNYNIQPQLVGGGVWGGGKK